MKKLLIILTLFLSTSVFAQHFHHRHYPPYRGHVHGNGWGWVAPIILGGVVGYAIAKPAQAEQPPIIVQPSNQVVINGMVYYKQLVYFDDCRCYREVLTQVVTPQ